MADSTLEALLSDLLSSDEDEADSEIQEEVHSISVDSCDDTCQAD